MVRDARRSAQSAQGGRRTPLTFFAGASDDEKAKAGETIVKRMTWLADTMEGDYLFGETVSVADCYLFVMLLWAEKNSVEAPAKLVAFRNRMMDRPAVRKAMTKD